MVIYINYDGINFSVFNSQVKLFLDKISKKFVSNISLINFDYKVKSNEYIEKQDKLEKELNIKVSSIEKRKNPELIRVFLLSNVIKDLSKCIKELNLDEEYNVFHCRGQVGSYITINAIKRLKLSNMKIVSDFRGEMLEEFKMLYGDRGLIYKIILKFVLKRLENIERIVINESDSILCVSNYFKNYLIEKYNVSPSKIEVVPTCVDARKFIYSEEQRNRVRKNLKIENKFVLVYSGAAQAWQKPDLVIKTFLDIKKNNKNAFLLIISRDKDEFEKYLLQYNVSSDDYTVISCDFNEVYKYLSSAEIGILLRENNLVNNVASPTKFAEYLACGLPVIVTKGIGDIDIIKANYDSLAIYTDELEKINDKLLDKLNDNKYNVVNKFYSWDVNLNKVVGVYNRLKGD